MTTQKHTLRMERIYKAPAEAVFNAFTSPEVMRRWFHSGVEWQTPEASVDLRIGGAVRVVMRNPDTDFEAGGGGVYSEIDPPRRLAFTWLWDRETRGTLIEIDFEESGGATTVWFTHSDLWDEATVKDHERGWSKAFDNLQRTLED